MICGVLFFFKKEVDVQNAWCSLRAPFSGGGHQRREALKNFFVLFSKKGLTQKFFRVCCSALHSEGHSQSTDVSPGLWSFCGGIDFGSDGPMFFEN